MHVFTRENGSVVRWSRVLKNVVKQQPMIHGGAIMSTSSWLILESGQGISLKNLKTWHQVALSHAFSSQDWGPWTKVWSGSSIRTSVDPRRPHSTTGGQDCTSSLRTTLTTLTTLAILRSGTRDDPQGSIALLGSRTRQGSCGGRSLLGPRSRGGGHPCLLAQLCGTYPSPCGIPLCCSNSLVRPLEGPCPCPCPHPCSCTAPCSSSCACSRICSRFDAQHTNPYLLCFVASCVQFVLHLVFMVVLSGGHECR